MLGRRLLRLCCVLILAGVFLGSAPAVHADDGAVYWPPGCVEQEVFDKNGERLEVRLFCYPPDPGSWKGILVVYAHGYVSPYAPLALPIEELGKVNGLELISGILANGFAFATTSYTRNGFAVEAADEDLDRLVTDFKAQHGPALVLLIGASEGALITTQQIETQPGFYNGGLALCGPVGGLPYQIQYLGDFRVVYDYFFPDVFSFGAVDVPDDAYLGWDTALTPAVLSAMAADPTAVSRLFLVTRAALDWQNPTASAAQTALQVLYYNIYGMNDIIATAKGVPYDNRKVWYWGLDPVSNWQLNQGVERVRAKPRAVRYTNAYYETTGKVQVPLITMHTLQDPAVPFRHELIYGLRVAQSGSQDNVTILPVPGYGHCTFEPWQVLGAFNLLVQQASGQSVSGMDGFALPESVQLDAIEREP